MTPLWALVSQWDGKNKSCVPDRESHRAPSGSYCGSQMAPVALGQGRGHSSALSPEGHSFDRPPRARPGHQLSAHPPGRVALQGNSKGSVAASRGGLWFHFLLCHGVGGGIGAQLASWGRHQEPGGQLLAQLPEHNPCPRPVPARMGAGSSGTPSMPLSHSVGRTPGGKARRE